MLARFVQGALGMTLLAGGLTAEAQEQRLLTPEETVQEALSASDAVRQARFREQAADSNVASVRGKLLPGINLSEEFLHYNAPFALAFPIPGLPPDVPAPSFLARAQNTNTFVAVASQPLLGLVHAGHEYGAAVQGLDAARAQTRTTESLVREQVRVGLLRLFQARAQKEIAHTSVEQLSEQLQLARSRIQAGVLTRADLLRVDVAVANSRQQEIQAGVQEMIARAQLLTLLGRNVHDTSLDFAAPEPLERRAAEPLPPEADATERALRARPEVSRAKAERGQAQLQARARGWALLPEINVVGGYTRINGQVFAPLNQEYVGIRAEWPIWDWGTRWYTHRAAYHQAEAAEAQEDDQRRQVTLEATVRLEEARAAGAAVEVAQAAIASAEEAYRVTHALLEAGSATTTDLLDAQSALTQAKLNWVRARYERAIARVGLDRAMGLDTE